jgi:tetratricopeptide (TPR) repeat protein
MLQFASVLGQVFPEDLLACYLEGIRSETSAGLPEDFNGALSLLVDAKLLRRRRTPDAETVSFRTPLARRVAYNTLLLHNRRILHGIAAAACLETASRAPRRSGMAARHLKLAGDGAEAMKHGLVRLKQAAGGYQTTETISWSDQLLDWAAEAGSGARAETLLEIMDHRRGALELEGRIAECRKTLERMMSLARSHGLPRWRTRVLIGQGSLMSVTGAPRKALELLEAGARMAGAHGCRDLLALALSNQASCRIRLGDLEEAEDNISAALRAADAVDDPTLAARCLLVRSQLEMSTGRLGPAEKTLRELLSREGGASVRIRMAATANLGAVLSGTGREREAERSFLEAMRGAESIGDRRVQASCLCNLAALRRRLGDPEAALESLRIALPLARRIDDDNLEGEVLLNMGTALADAGDSNGAFSRSLEAFELLRRLGGSRHLGLALRNAAVFAERAERREHLPKLMDAIDSARELLGPEERAQALVLAARAARRMGLMLRASQLVGTARGCLSGGGGLLLAEIHALQGICHLAGGSREEAGRALSKAESLLGEDSPKEDLEADLLELRKNLREE